jgi:CO/xanthine dehydrogenase Mo-binding subunit
MRWRGIAVLTNTPPRTAQRGPGHNQTVSAVEPLIDKAARELGLSPLEIRRVNAPPRDALFGGAQTPVTSCYLKEALEQAATAFNWSERAAASGERTGSKVRGFGIGQAYHPAGFTGFDGIVRITPDGKLHIHTGIGNLGTYSHSGTARIAAEVLKYDWDNCIVERGDTRMHLPWNIGQFGSNTSFTMARTNYVAAMDALARVREIAAMDLGGVPDDYDIADESVFSKADPERTMTFAAVAARAIELGGRFDGHEMNDDMNPMTKTSVAALAGTGLVGAARDNLPITASPAAFVVGMAEIELDVETGRYQILDYLAVVDCGTVIHPQGLATQIKGGAVMGIGMATLERHIYDPQNGLPGSVGLYQAKPASYLDVPSVMRSAAVDQPDPQSPLGTKGVGEPVMGAASAAVLCAISDALGGHYFNRVPVTADQIVNAAAGRPQSHAALQVNTA